MNDSSKTKETILRNAKSIIQNMYYELNEMNNPRNKLKMATLMNFITHGRTVTFIVQNLKSVVPNFDDWYTKYQDEMRSDPLMSYFKNARNEIEKEGIIRASSGIHVKSMRFPEDLAKFQTPPEEYKSYVKGFFMCDQLGGSGWEIILPDGTEMKHYIELPEDSFTTNIALKDLPKTHLGRSIEGLTTQEICKLYVDYLRNIVILAKRQFAN